MVVVWNWFLLFFRKYMILEKYDFLENWDLKVLKPEEDQGFLIGKLTYLASISFLDFKNVI